MRFNEIDLHLSRRVVVRLIGTGAAAIGLLAATSCGNSNGDPPAVGGVGSPCTDNSQCGGYKAPACMQALKPLENLTIAGAKNADVFMNLTLPYPGGYCSTTMQNFCATDADCGEGGGCFIPFQGVSQDVITALGKYMLPFDIAAFSKAGICLKPCTDTSQCRTDQQYQCLVPIKAFMDVINPTYTRQFCFQNVDVSYLLQ